MTVDRSFVPSTPKRVFYVSDFLKSLSGLSGGAEFRLAASRSGDGEVKVRRHTLSRKAFCFLRHFEPPSACEVPKVLVVAPLSGQYAVLLQDVITGFLPDHSVYMTDWRDARDVSVKKGKFDLEDNIAYVIDFLSRLGPETHVLAVCQSAVPALAATALLAAADDPCQPRSLILMGGLIDTRINPTRIDRIAQTSLFQRLQHAAITFVPPGFPGAGRRIYPATVQRAGLFAYVARHIEFAPEDVLRLRIRGDPMLADPDFLKRLLNLMDLPAELYLQNIKAVLQDHALPRRSLIWRGQRVEPQAISQTGLMTVEGEYDDISGSGQTRAAQDLCRGIPSGKRRHFLQTGIGHFGMYTGRSWFESVLPQVRNFIRDLS